MNLGTKEIENLENFNIVKNETKEENKIIVFLLECLAPSRKYQEILNNLIGRDISMNIYLVNVEKHMDIAFSENIKSFPTTYILKNGKIDILKGVLSEQQLEEFLTR